MSDGQDLLDVANVAWNDRRGEYSGPYFRQAVNKAMAQNVPDKHTKRKVRREEAATTIAHIFDVARQSDAERLDKVATNAVEEDNGEGTDIRDFATEVSEAISNTEAHSGFGILDPMTLITLITTILQTVIPLFQSCKKPVPTT